jgi:hypothetical protein
MAAKVRVGSLLGFKGVGFYLDCKTRWLWLVQRVRTWWVKQRVDDLECFRCVEVDFQGVHPNRRFKQQDKRRQGCLRWLTSSGKRYKDFLTT